MTITTVELLAVEEWSLTFYGSPPSVMVRSGIPGLPDSRRDIAFMEFANREERAEKGAALSAIVGAHNEQATLISNLVKALEEARLQLEYLDERFPTGTTPPILARIDTALRSNLDKEEGDNG